MVPTEVRMDEEGHGRGWRVAAGILAMTTVAAGVAGYRLGSADEAAREPAVVVAGDDTTVSDLGSDWTGARPVLARTAADGTLVRVLEARWPQEHVPPDSWVPPPQCLTVGSLEIGLVSDDAVATGGSNILGEPPERFAVWGSGWTGYPTLGPFLYGAVRVTEGVGSVRLVRDGTVLDEAAPAGGWAVVAARAEPVRTGEPRFDGTLVEVLGDDGHVLAAMPLGATELSEPRRECEAPPPPLPAAARPTGTDDAAAVAAIRVAYRGVFEPGADVRAHLTGGDRLDDALLAQVRQGAADMGIDGVTVEFHELGFVGDDRAVVTFRLDGAPLGWMHGGAVLVDGMWKVDAQTWCSLIAGLGPTCPEDVWSRD
jgi:hypothetical protein